MNSAGEYHSAPTTKAATAAATMANQFIDSIVPAPLLRALAASEPLSCANRVLAMTNVAVNLDIVEGWLASTLIHVLTTCSEPLPSLKGVLPLSPDEHEI